MICRLGLAVVSALGCSGQNKAEVPQTEEPARAAVPRVELGRCSGLEQAFVSGRLAPLTPGGLETAAAPVGALSQTAILRTIRADSRKMQRCYQQALKRRPGLSGKAVVRIEIAKSGAVSHASITQALDPEVDRCIVDAIRSLTFPPSSGSSTVSFPFVFQAAGGTSDLERSVPSAKLAAGLAEPRRLLGAPAVPDHPTPLEPARAALESCAREHLHSASPYDAAVIDLEPGKRPAGRSARDNSKLATCLGRAAAAIAVTEPMRCPVALGQMPIAAAPVVEVRGGEIVYAGKPATLAELKDALEAYRAAIRAKAAGEPVLLMGPVIVQLRRADPIDKALEVIRVAGTADLHVALAVEESGQRTLVRGVPLPWVPVHGHRTDRPELPLLIDVLDARELGALEARLKSADPRSIVTVSVDPQLSAGELVGVLETLRRAGLDDWRLRRAP